MSALGATWQRVRNAGLLLLLLIPMWPAAPMVGRAAPGEIEQTGPAGWRLTFVETGMSSASAPSAPSAHRAPSAPSAPQPQVDHFAGGLLLTWQAGRPQFAPSEGGLRVRLPGWPELRRPGAPIVPLAAALVALPPGAQPWLELVSVEEAALALPAALAGTPADLAGTPAALARAPAAQSGAPAALVAQPDAPGLAAQTVAEPAPLELGDQPVQIELLGRLRGVELARIVFYPLLPDANHLRHFRQLTARLHFYPTPPAAPLAETGAADLAADPILSALAGIVLNPEDIHFPGSAHVVTQGAPRAQGARRAPLPDDAYAFDVTQPGLVALSYEALAAGGVNVGALTPANVQVSRGDELLAADWQGDADAVFEPGERLLVVAEPRFSRYSAAETFYVWQDDQPALRASARSVAPGAQPAAAALVDVTFEKNQIYTPNCYCAPLPAGRDGDRWVWQRLALPDQASAAFPFQLGSLDPAQPGMLALWLIGFTDVAADIDHRVFLELNDVSLGELMWGGKQEQLVGIELPAGLLKTGQNELRLSLPGLPGVTVEGAWLDAFSVRIALGSQSAGGSVLFYGQDGAHLYSLTLNTAGKLHLYDISDPLNPQRLVDGQAAGATLTFGDNSAAARRYLAAAESALLAPSNLRRVGALHTAGLSGADYLVIALGEFWPALQPLLDLRQAEGFSLALEDPQAIYDAFGQGQPDPQAIRAFLADAYARWSPRPLYVLLVGDGSADPRNYATPGPDPIPAFLAEVDPWAGETAADNRYAAVDGSDLLPDLLIGRLPVNSLAETQAVVAKLVNAAAQPPDVWKNTAVFVADNADSAGNFMGASQAIAEMLPAPPWSRQRLYYVPNAGAPEGLRADLLAAWENGAAFIQYSGHASIHQWAAERFMHIDDVPSLGNGARLPVALELTCFTGAFHTPGLASLDEALLRQADGGALAVWGATGLGLASGHLELAEGFVGALSQGHSLGQAALAGKLKLLEQQNTFLDLVDTYTLFGDPAVQPSWGVKATIYLPMIGRSVAPD